MPARRLLTAMLLAIAGLATGMTVRADAPGVALVLDIEGPIGPATNDYVRRGLEKAQARGAGLVILRIDTPGGLDLSMREIIKAILASPVPVASYVAPSGARAASAGTYILYASHVAAMAPGTNLGAATPVSLGGPARPEPQGAEPEAKKGDKEAGRTKASGTPHVGMHEKILNDATAYIRGLAKMRGRNVEWAEKAVREAASLPADEALKLNVIDLIATDINDLLAKIDGRTVDVAGRDRKLSTRDLRAELLAPDWRTELLAVITNPNVAYILMLIGIYGLALEAYNPGVFVAGITGAISLLLAAYAFQLLPVNYAGLALLLLGLALIVAESFVPSFGALGIGGIAAFVIGSVMLMDTDVPGFGISWTLIGSIALVAAGGLLLVILMLMRSRRRAVVTGIEQMIGDTGRVIEWNDGRGRIRIHGEIWQARCRDALASGGRVRVKALDGLILVVEPAAESEEVTP